MAGRDVRARIARRAQLAGVRLPGDRLDLLERYTELLRLWNRRINLTSLGLEPLTDEAIDRLLVEPIVAGRHVLDDDRILMDVGSGGGSPAIPLRLCAPQLRLVMVEVKVRKAAFLREAVRQLSLQDVEVENRRFEELLARTELHEAVDLVTVRAVRADRRLWSALQTFLRPGGRVFWFGGATGSSESFPAFEQVSTHTLIPSVRSGLAILQRR